MSSNLKQHALFPKVFDKPLSVEFTQPCQSSDGGVVLLKCVDQKIGLIDRLADAIEDPRQPGKITHSIRDLLRERIFGIACGYEDCNDAAHLSQDPVMKMVCDRSPLSGEDLASQPTLSRFENSLSRADLIRMAYALTDTVIDAERVSRRRKRNPRKITIDLDPTDDPAYGDQQLTFFNAHYRNWCFLPMATSIQFDDEQDQHIVAPVLRPGNAKGSLGAIGILKRLVPRLRKAFPTARLYARMDGAFSTPEIFKWLESEKILYAINMGRNSVLNAKAEKLMKRVRGRTKKSGETETEFGEALYQATRWKKERRAIIKAEVTQLEGRESRDNQRFLITNLKWTPKNVYKFYRGRGDMENRIKELKHGLEFGRTSCTSFQANQFRNLLTAAAYVLYQQLRKKAFGTSCERAQVGTLRNRLIKIGVVIRESVRRIVFEAPRSYAWLSVFRTISQRFT